VETDADIYITGSNAKLLSGEYTTLLSGRYHELPVLPLSFSEYLSAIRDKEPQLSTADAFRKYLRVGGMPFVTAFGLNETDAEAYLEDIYASVVIKDIVRRNKLRNVELLERILMYVFANIGQTFSANSISKYFVSEKRKVSPETVLNYLRAAQDAYLIHRLNRLDVPSKRLLKVDEKYAVVDHGLREAIFGGNERDIERVLENIVCLELMGRGYKVRVGRVANREIDFVCDRGKERLYVQVAYLLANEETIRREFGVYADVPDNFPKYVLSLDEVDLSREGIQHMNIRDFLLNA
jgi:predicted AAA+ superfamily ATPase